MSMEERVLKVEAEVAALSQRVTSVETTQAVQANDRAHMDKRFDRLEAAQTEMSGWITKLVWVVVAGILTAVLQFLLKGGLNAGVS